MADSEVVPRARAVGEANATAGRLWDGTLLAVAVAAWCLLLLAGWLPQYLTRPWHADHDHFAMLAQAWASLGEVPYRDTFSTQFPGEIYLFGLLGVLGGWGDTVAFNAADAGMLVGLCGLMVAWSRRACGRVLPGLLGAASLLGFYLDQDYTMTGQRDWHASVYAIAGLIVVAGWPGRGARAVSAAGYAMALATRPQFALLAPAMLMAASRQPSGAEASPRASVRRLLEWVGFVVVGLALAFAPIVAAGAFDDFVRCLRSVAYGSSYNRATPSGVASRLYVQAMARLNVLVVPAALWGVSRRLGPGSRWLALTVIVALGGQFLYGPISPIDLPYHRFPFEAALAFAVCVLAAWLLEVPGDSAMRMAALLLLFGLTGLRKPEYVGWKGDFDERTVVYHGTPYVIRDQEYGVREAVGFLRAGELPAGHPPGFRDTLRPYPWDDLRALILHLREHTGEETPVLNLVLDGAAAINGAIPRVSGLPADRFSLVSYPEATREMDLRAVEAAGDRVVVWNPVAAESEFPEFADVWKAVRAHYRPEAKFGDLQVWRRRP